MASLSQSCSCSTNHQAEDNAQHHLFSASSHFFSFAMLIEPSPLSQHTLSHTIKKAFLYHMSKKRKSSKIVSCVWFWEILKRERESRDFHQNPSHFSCLGHTHPSFTFWSHVSKFWAETFENLVVVSFRPREDRDGYLLDASQHRHQILTDSKRWIMQDWAESSENLVLIPREGRNR